MKYDIKVERHSPNIAVLSASGTIAIGSGEVAMREKVSELLDNGYTRLALVLEQTQSMDSAGLGGLVSFYTRAKSLGGTVVLVRPAKLIREVLTLTRLSSVFEQFDSVEEALSYLRAFEPASSDHIPTS